MNQACNRELSLMAKTVQKKYLLGFHHGNHTAGLPQLAVGTHRGGDGVSPTKRAVWARGRCSRANHYRGLREARDRSLKGGQSGFEGLE